MTPATNAADAMARERGTCRRCSTDIIAFLCSMLT
jgi:hypothetical protein